MNVGEEFEFYGIPLRAEREMSDLSCEGCFFKYISTKGCKHDHIVFICLDSEKGDPFIEKRRNLARMK